MSKNRKEKEKIIKSFANDFRKAKILVFTDYFGIRANELNQLRRTLKENGCKYQVIKKTFLEKILEKDGKAEVEAKKLPGGLGVIFGLEDEVSWPKIALKFSKKEAVEYCKHHPETALVFMDIKMPVMDGYEATRQIRKLYPALPIVAQTAHAMTEDKNTAFLAGCNDYLVKPILKENLKD